jgi:hypothetical protein
MQLDRCGEDIFPFWWRKQGDDNLKVCQWMASKYFLGCMDDPFRSTNTNGKTRKEKAATCVTA